MHRRSITCRCRALATLLAAVAFGPGLASRAADPPALPQGPGLAARYPGDAGLARDRAVLLAEDFETGGVADLGKRWSSVSNKDDRVLRFSDDVPAASAGRRSLEMTSSVADNTGGHLYSRLPRGADRAFARFYVKFPEGGSYVHHFVHLGGYRPATAWPQGGAGERPKGDDRVTVGIEPHGDNGRLAPPGAWTFYAYWQDMKVSAGNRYWGNAIRGPRPAVVPRDRWQCVEIMMKLNSAPDHSDGELALWLDGVPTYHVAPGVRRGPWTGMGFTVLKEGGEPFEGFRFRSTTDLKINFFWLLYYVTPEALRRNGVKDLPKSDRVLFDDIVVATEYIGPVTRK